MITRDRSLLAQGISIRLLQGVLREHRARREDMRRQRAYYDGCHDILHRRKTSGTANNRLVTNHAKYIVDLASAYLIGSPVGYSDDAQEAALAALAEAYRRCNVDSVDAELARHAGIYGTGIELLYMDAGGQPRTAALDPRDAFVVYDNTVAHAPLFGVHRVQCTDELGQPTDQALTVYTGDRVLRYTLAREGEAPVPQMEEGRPEGRPGPEDSAAGAPEGQSPANPQDLTGRWHYFGGVPLVEYWNNEDERGDFEPVRSLIDAYNLLQSDRLNDKEQLVDALLVIVGASLGDTDAEFAAAAKKLRDEKIFELPAQDADAKYLTKQLTESEVQVLADALAADIHKIAMVPALTDEDFAGTASGVALRYKLLGLEQLTKTKERWFREGLRSRMRLFAHVLSVKGQAALDAERVRMTFSRGLPVNDFETAQMVSMLRGLVPDEVLLKQLSFIGDGGMAQARQGRPFSRPGALAAEVGEAARGEGDGEARRIPDPDTGG